MKKLLLIFLFAFMSCSDQTEQKQNSARVSENSENSENSKQFLENSENSENSAPQIVIKKAEANKTKINENIVYDMDGQQKIKKFSLGEENATTRTIGAISLQRRPLESVDRALLRGMLSKNFLLKCSACHDDYANGIIGPSLLKMDKEQIFSAIKAFQHKEKANVLMSDLIKRMKDDEIKSLADEIHEFNENIRTRSKK